MPISGCHDLPLATFNLPSRVFRHGCRRAECLERRWGGFFHTLKSGRGCHRRYWRFWRANPPPLIRRRGFYASALLRYNSAMLVSGNWKMHGSAEFVRKWLDEWESARDGVSNAVEVAVFPPFPFLGALADGEKRGFVLGGQDCSAESVGARTGEVSAGMLAECGCRFALAERNRGLTADSLPAHDSILPPEDL